MDRKILGRVLALGVLLPVVIANRTVPRWQGFRKSSLQSTERCVTSGLVTFGKVKVERGEEPEAGNLRLVLSPQTDQHPRLSATLFVEGDATFSHLWMDARDARFGRAVWRVVKNRCRLS